MNKLSKTLRYTAGTLAVIAAVSQTPAIPSEAAPKEVIVTETSADKDMVTVTVSQTKAKRISSGKITLLYDDDALTLSDQKSSGKYAVEDVNTNAGKNGDGGVSVAFADRSAKKKDRELLTARFKVKSKAAGKNVELNLVVDELYNEDDSVAKAGTESKLDVKTEPVEKWVGQVSGIRVSHNTKEVKVSYNELEGADGYEVFRADSKDQNYTKIMKTDKTKVYDKMSNLQKGHTYLYKVRGYKNIDGTKVTGDFSSVKSVKIPTYKGFSGFIGWLWDSLH